MEGFLLIGLFCLLAVVGFFVSDRPFKFAIGGIVFLAAIAFVILVGYIIYILIVTHTSANEQSVPQYTTEQQSSASAQDGGLSCNQKAALFSEQFATQSSTENPGIISFVPMQYHLSQKLNACLSENGYVFPDHGATGTYMQITDVDSGNIVLQSVQNIYEQTDAAKGIVTYSEFMAEAPAIMSQ